MLFLHVPARKDIRDDAERNQVDLLCGNVDLVVLARYMQVLTSGFLDEAGCPLINIHHSFLPPFIGVYRRGTISASEGTRVKVVGADRHDVDDLARLGRRRARVGFPS